MNYQEGQEYTVTLRVRREHSGLLFTVGKGARVWESDIIDAEPYMPTTIAVDNAEDFIDPGGSFTIEGVYRGGFWYRLWRWVTFRKPELYVFKATKVGNTTITIEG